MFDCKLSERFQDRRPETHSKHECTRPPFSQFGIGTASIAVGCVLPRKTEVLRVAKSAAVSEDLLQFLRGNNLQLRVSALARIFFCSPSAKVSHVAKTIPLHVLVSDLDNELGT